MMTKQRREDLAGYDLRYDGDGGYTTGTIRVITEPIPATAVMDFLHKDGVVHADIELEKGSSRDHRRILDATLAPELRDGAVVVDSSRYGGGSFSYFSPETAAGSEAVRVAIDVSAPLRSLIARGLRA